MLRPLILETFRSQTFCREELVIGSLDGNAAVTLDTAIHPLALSKTRHPPPIWRKRSANPSPWRR
jgi:hypothetical protein